MRSIKSKKVVYNDDGGYYNYNLANSTLFSIIYTYYWYLTQYIIDIIFNNSIIDLDNSPDSNSLANPLNFLLTIISSFIAKLISI